jgi:DNA-binding YbaB/EbfC family protein
MKGFPGMPGNIQQLMKQAQKMQEDLKRVQADAELVTMEGSAGGGMVKVVANGKNQLVSIVIDRQVVNPDDIEMLQDLTLAACNDALEKVQENMKQQMSKLTSGMNIPGMF